MKTVVIVFTSLVSLSVHAQSDSSTWDLAKLNTGRTASYLSPLEKEILLELNKVRSDPKRYARLYISPLLDHFDGKLDG